MIPSPEEKTMRAAIRNLANFMPKDDAFIAQNLVDMAIYDAAGDRCLECGRSMTSSGHYAAYLCCTKCRFSTCCAAAMAKHQKYFCSAREFNLNKPTITKELMYCVCGFSTYSGNKMAAHLARSGCRTAYPSAEEAAKARVDVTTEEATVNKDKTDEDKANEEPDNMDTDTAGVNDGDSEKETEETSDGSKKMEQKTESENVSVMGKETSQEVENREEEEEEKMDEDNGKTNDSEKGEKDKESHVDKANADEKEKGTDEARKPPLPGGLLFGTFFNYMGGDQNSDEKGINEKESEDGGSAEDDNERSKDRMETQ